MGPESIYRGNMSNLASRETDHCLPMADKSEERERENEGNWQLRARRSEITKERKEQNRRSEGNLLGQRPHLKSRPRSLKTGKKERRGKHTLTASSLGTSQAGLVF